MKLTRRNKLKSRQSSEMDFGGLIILGILFMIYTMWLSA